MWKKQKNLIYFSAVLLFTGLVLACTAVPTSASPPLSNGGGEEKPSYRVSFLTNGSGVPFTNVSVAEGDTVPEPTPPPTKVGNHFRGWYGDRSFTNAFNFSNAITSNTTLYSRWELKSYTVTFNTGTGGSAVAAQNVKHGSNVVKPSPAPKRVGHRFDSWYVDSGLTISFNFRAPITNAITVYAGWKANSYTVSFVMNGGTPAVAEQNVPYTNKATLPSAPTRVGHSFAGWFANAETNIPFKFSAPITNAITAYAGWRANSYTVSFVMNGGTPAVAEQNVPYTNKAAPPTDPMRAGHSFAGWFANAATNIPFKFTAPITNAITAYAAWVRQSYIVNFIMNGGTPAEASQSVKYTNKATKPGQPTRAGHTFAGWFANAATNIPFKFSAPITNAITAYAAWVRRSYTVTFNTGGGSEIASQNILYTNKVAPPSAPTRVGHSFAGWFANAGTNIPFKFSAPITDAITAYAGWRANSYTVTFNTGGGSAVAAQSVLYTNKAAPPTAPMRAGHSFAGWFANAETNIPFKFSAPITNAITAYAAWVRQSYTVTFEMNGGTPAVASQSVKYTNKAAPPSAPMRAGLSFAGWFANAELNLVFNFGAVEITSNTIVYAGWVESYSVGTVSIRYATNFYGDRTAPTLSWAVTTGSAQRQELYWGETAAAMTKLTDLGANSRSYTVPTNRIATINGQKTYYWQLKGASSSQPANSSAVYTAVLHSCGAPQGGFTMVCSTNTLSGVNAKGLAGKYKLQNDLDLGGREYANSIIAPNNGTTTSFSGVAFSGEFDGNGKVIKNGSIAASSRSYVGVFGHLAAGAVVKNLGVALSVTGNERVGGVVGGNSSGTLTNVYATGAVTGVNHVGGLVGGNSGGSLTQVYATGAVKGHQWLGGLVGDNSGSLVSRAYATGTVSAADPSGSLLGLDIGGLMGRSVSATLVDVYATGAVSGFSRAGGLIGNSVADLVNKAYSVGSLTRVSGSAATTFGRVFGALTSPRTLTALYYRGSAGFPTGASPPSDPGPGSPSDMDSNLLNLYNDFGITAGTTWTYNPTLRRPVLRNMPPGAER